MLASLHDSIWLWLPATHTHTHTHILIQLQDFVHLHDQILDTRCIFCNRRSNLLTLFLFHEIQMQLFSWDSRLHLLSVNHHFPKLQATSLTWASWRSSRQPTWWMTGKVIISTSTSAALSLEPAAGAIPQVSPWWLSVHDGSIRARIWEEGLTNHSPPAFLSLLFWVESSMHAPVPVFRPGWVHRLYAPLIGVHILPGQHGQPTLTSLGQVCVRVYL